MTEQQLAAAIEGLDARYRELKELVSGLSEAQWRFVPNEQSWGAALCCEHIAIVEAGVVVGLRRAGTEGKEFTIGKEDRLPAQAADRTFKFNAPERVRPKRRFADPGAFLAHYDEVRLRTLAYARDPESDLDNRVMKHPAFGELTAYQWLVLLAAHSGRHADQIREVIAHPDFPPA